MERTATAWCGNVVCVEREAIRTTRRKGEKKRKSTTTRDSGRSDAEVRSVPSLAPTHCLQSPVRTRGQGVKGDIGEGDTEVERKRKRVGRENAKDWQKRTHWR